MRIGMFSNSYKPIISGVVRSIDLYRQGLTNAGHFVALFTSDAKDHEDAEPFVFRYPSITLPKSTDWTLPVVVAPHITWLIPRLKLDILHAHHPFVIGSEALNISRGEKIPLVFTFHTLYHEYTHYFGLDADFVKQLVRRHVRDYVDGVDCIIAPSTYILDLLPSYQIDRSVEILPTPVDLSLFPTRERPPFSDPERIQLIYVGRVGKEKNLDFLLRAFARAAQQDTRLHLRIVGDGPELKKLLTYAAELQVTNRVDFIGAVPFEQVAEQMSQADLFVFTSTTETQGLVLLEAMAASLHQVIVNSPALHDFVRPGVDALSTDID
ncbi:MAG TPA: glycosyltransferase family 4 protein, partial [Caldilineae bacterium]|nr:glycosyltransferase family 4 protein [Caldilineae bacterium]